MFFQIDDLADRNFVNSASNNLSRLLVVAWPENDDHDRRQDRTHNGKGDHESSHP